MQCDAVLPCDSVALYKHVRCLNVLPNCWVLLKMARVDTQRHDRGVTTASYRGGSCFKSGHSD